MDIKDFDALLEASIADGVLTRTEESEIRDLVKGVALDARKRPILRSRVFDVASRGLAEGPEKTRIDWLRRVMNALDPQGGSASAAVQEVLFSPGETCVRRICGLLDAAQSTVEVCVFTITDDRIAQSLLGAHGRRVSIRVVTDNEKSDEPGSDIERFKSKGIPVAVDRSPFHMHHKFAIFDGTILLNGSYNWTRGAATSNEENLVVSADPGLIRAFAGEFERLWKKFAT